MLVLIVLPSVLDKSFEHLRRARFLVDVCWFNGFLTYQFTLIQS